MDEYFPKLHEYSIAKKKNCQQNTEKKKNSSVYKLVESSGSMNGDDVEGNCRDVFQGTIPSPACRVGAKTTKKKPTISSISGRDTNPGPSEYESVLFHVKRPSH
jgi:hypothetical protein